MRKSALVEPPNEMKLKARQWRADLIERAARCQGSKIDGDEASAIDQIDHDLLGYLSI